MSIDFPIHAASLLTVGGIAVLGAVIAMWFKHYLANWRWTPLFVLGICLVFSILAQIVDGGWPLTLERALVAILIALFGASLAVFGYETISNALGLLGVGPRSPASQVTKAQELLATQGFVVGPRPR